MTLHEGELAVDQDTVHRLLRAQFPALASLAVEPAGHGTDNTMYRLGDQLVARLPRTAHNAEVLGKELVWLPRLAPHLRLEIPAPVAVGEPSDHYPLRWAIYRWIDGETPSTASVSDWLAYGTDLARFVRALHSIDRRGEIRGGLLDWYRGGVIQDLALEMAEPFADLHAKAGDRLDVDALEQCWQRALELPRPSGRQVWMHGDLRPSNLLVREGRLAAVLDFGGLSIGYPDCEHAIVWDLPTDARTAYRNELELDDDEWRRARAWSLAIAVNALTYYWDTFPEMVTQSMSRLNAILRSL